VIKLLSVELHTLIHKLWILYYIVIFCIRLIWRGIIHDISKFKCNAEAKLLSENIGKLKYTTYGSKKYFNLLKDIQPFLDHHYTNNRHHPEHYLNGYKEMSLIDIVEMFLDWKAATKKHNNGDMRISIKTNKERFSLSDDIVEIFTNSI